MKKIHVKRRKVKLERSRKYNVTENLAKTCVYVRVGEKRGEEKIVTEFLSYDMEKGKHVELDEWERGTSVR